MHIRTYATLRDLLGVSALDLALPGQADVRYVLDQVVAAHPTLAGKLWDAAGNWSGFVTVLLNGRSVEYLQGLATPVRDDDNISLFPPVGGG
ncbi:MAG: sulfur-carrier protein [Chloroflexota bacterium]|nr:sulfur-carrier protein [Chloroflexota bacterium]